MKDNLHFLFVPLKGQSVSRHEEDQEDTRMKKKGIKPVKNVACLKTRKKIKKNQRGQIGTICYKKCFLWFCDHSYCKGDKICCTPGKKGGGCCPYDYPVCLGPHCCPRGNDKICSGPTCCPPHQKCCPVYGCCNK